MEVFITQEDQVHSPANNPKYEDHHVTSQHSSQIRDDVHDPIQQKYPLAGDDNVPGPRTEGVVRTVGVREKTVRDTIETPPCMM